MKKLASLVSVPVVLALFAMGCAAPEADGGETAVDNIESAQGAHAPKGAEQKAILDGLRAYVQEDLNGQRVLFNYTDPVGHFEAHGDWAYFAGIIEGPNGNRTPIDYKNSVFKDVPEDFFDGAERNGNFAASIFALMKKEADGTWHPALGKGFGDVEHRAYAIGPTGSVYEDFREIAPAGVRDIF